MENSTQLDLIERALYCLEQQTTHMVETSSAQPVEYYYSNKRLEKEQQVLFRQYPVIVAHASELKKPGDFVSHDETGIPIVVIHGEDGRLKAFINVCRHRGTRLVPEKRGGGKKAFVCPYHGWTYDQEGKLIHITDRIGFPDLNCDQMGLVSVAVESRYGFVWVKPVPGSSIDIATYLGAIGGEIEAFAGADNIVYKPTVIRRTLNWKLVVDIFLEAYHVKYVHRNSIYPIFFNNVGLHDRFYPHSRNTFPKRKILELKSIDKKEWSIRPYANLLYFIFPNTLLLVEPDHIAVVTVFPDGTDNAILLTATLLPAFPSNEKEERYWGKNIDILMTAVNEDLLIGESIQKGLRSGANTHLTFARFEQSLKCFHDAIEDALKD
ncbi:MAG: SRPBCC family protein [Acidobacteriota bacterium]